MAYIKNIWENQDVERPKTYEVTDNPDGSITLTDSFGTITKAGTPVNATNMNHIEDGVAGCAIRKHNLTETFNLGEWVLGGTGNDEGIYKSLVANNVGNAITNDTYWEKVKMGGSSRNIGEIVASTVPLTDTGLHLLDGALINGSGSYSDFVDYIADIYDNAELCSGDLIKLPTFTSNTQDNITISDSRNNTTVLQDIFNGANTFNQIGAWNTYWINIDYNEPTYINYYSIQADNNGNIEYPSAWTLQASNDGSNWTTINTQTGITFVLGEYKKFYVNSEVTYKQYRIVFSNGVESSGNGELQRVSFNVNSQAKSSFTTEEKWQQSVTYYGVCGKFVYNSTNNTVRLPKITGIIEGTTDVTALGDLVEAGLPNITGSAYNWGWCANGDSEGAFTVDSYSSANSPDVVANPNIGYAGWLFDASRSSLIYGNSSTVQPQTIKAFYYIVVATSTKTDIQVDIDEIATDLNGKADVDLTNLSDTGNIQMAKASMPSDTFIDLTLGADGSNYTSPAAGYYYFLRTLTSSGYQRLTNSTCNFASEVRTHIDGGQIANFIPVNKGDTMTVTYDGSYSEYVLRFIYAKGSESEAS